MFVGKKRDTRGNSRLHNKVTEGLRIVSKFHHLVGTKHLGINFSIREWFPAKSMTVGAPFRHRDLFIPEKRW